MHLDQCDPNTLATVDSNSVAVKQENEQSMENDEILDTLFGETTQLVTQWKSGIAINSNLVPCIHPQLVCCKPSQQGNTAIPEAIENWPIIECGIHNENGISQKDVTQRIGGISSQEGEWPHACII